MIAKPNGTSQKGALFRILAPDAGRDFEALYRRADAALYRAKAAGRNRFAVDGASGLSGTGKAGPGAGSRRPQPASRSEGQPRAHQPAIEPPSLLDG